MQASRRAILNANYMAKRLENDFNVLYRSAEPAVLSVHMSALICRRQAVGTRSSCLLGHVIS
jgi:glycine cleavage system protein P-like pyridoxal-binding family